MKHALSVFAVVFVALLAMAGRAEAADYVTAPDYAGAWYGIACTSVSQCGSTPAGYAKFCDARPGYAQRYCVTKKIVCGTEPNATSVLGWWLTTSGEPNDYKQVCQYTCVPGTSYDPVLQTCVTCASGTCCANGTVYRPGEGYCGSYAEMPEARTLGGNRRICEYVPLEGKYRMVSSSCNYNNGGGYICDDGQCVDIDISCTTDADCTRNFVPIGECEPYGGPDPYQGFEMWYNVVNLTTYTPHLCVNNRCSVASQGYFCYPNSQNRSSYNDEGCRCLQAAGYPIR